jgi:AraC family transcriptional activator of tynA and feaB
LASTRGFGKFAAMSEALQAFQRWSTDDVPPAQRLDYWMGAVCEGFLEMDITSPEQGSRFGASLESMPLGPLVVNEVRGSAQDVYRTRRAIAHSRHNYYYLLCKTDAAWTMAQDGRCARLLPGDPVLVDSRRLYEFHLLQSADTLSLELPTAWVDAWLPDAGDQVARRIDGQAGWGGVLSGFVRQLTPQMAAKPPLPAQLLSDQLGSLLALALGQGQGQGKGKGRAKAKAGKPAAKPAPRCAAGCSTPRASGMPSRASPRPAWRVRWAFRSAACTAAWPMATPPSRPRWRAFACRSRAACWPTRASTG